MIPPNDVVMYPSFWMRTISVSLQMLGSLRHYLHGCEFEMARAVTFGVKGMSDAIIKDLLCEDM